LQISRTISKIRLSGPFLSCFSFVPFAPTQGVLAGINTRATTIVFRLDCYLALVFGTLRGLGWAWPFWGIQTKLALKNFCQKFLDKVFEICYKPV